MAQARYVVLHHTGIDQPHFDLLIDADGGSPLLAWRTEHWPVAPNAAFQRLPDHRRCYLDYEGPISGNRGQVRRVAYGVCTLSPHPTGWELTLDDGACFSLPSSSAE